MVSDRRSRFGFYWCSRLTQCSDHRSPWRTRVRHSKDAESSKHHSLNSKLSSMMWSVLHQLDRNPRPATSQQLPVANAQRKLTVQLLKPSVKLALPVPPSPVIQTLSSAGSGQLHASNRGSSPVARKRTSLAPLSPSMPTGSELDSSYWSEILIWATEILE